MNTTNQTTEPRTHRYIVKCFKCHAVTSGTSTGQECNRLEQDIKRTGDVFTSDRGHHVMRCKACGTAVHANRVRGVYSPEHVCSDRCLSATGLSCECSCGGKNHGAGHAA